ncbi:MAG: 4Fe-4S dicluster domain-containing protein [Gemmatimonadota bacterium]|nr:4Fe-4S dicluster domain-containing protein [Gemmatimonadota bacterium]
MSAESDPAQSPARPSWAKVVDQTRCIGCHACTTACKSENEVPLSVTRTYVKYVDTGTFPQARRSFQVTRCNQCESPPCVAACPTAAMFKRPDGIVDFDKSVCIGCKACIAACPYDAIFINPEDHSAEKCNFCAHRLDVGLEPACVVVCPTEALLVGDMNDPSSEVARIINRDPVSVRRPEKETKPKLYYKGADQVTLDPLAAQRPEGGLFMWSEQGEVDHGVPSGHPGPWNSSAAAVLSYDIPHRAPWDFRVSLYTWTKSIAAGAYLAPLLLLATGALGPASPLWTWAAPILAGVFLALTGAILIWDLEHPARFHLIFRRPQWRSWLVRGGFIIGGYSAVLAAHFAVALTGASPPLWLGWTGGGLAVLTAIYTAFLFGQAKARDMWQNPLLPVHFLVQAVLAGAGAVVLAAVAMDGLGGALNGAVSGAGTAAGASAGSAGASTGSAGVATAALQLFAVASGAHLLMIAGEVFMPPPTAHARLAEREMTHGRFRGWFRVGVLGALLGVAAPWLAAGVPWLGLAAVAAGLIALLAYEHAYVQAGQSVPIA